MRKRILMLAAGILVLFSGFVFAGEKGMMNEGMTDKSMMGSRMEKKMIATQDGGIVIWAGNKLIKYDKNLKLVKEIELNFDKKETKNKMKWSYSQDDKECSAFKMSGPYHRKPGEIKSEEDVDPQTIDPYHHAPKN